MVPPEQNMPCSQRAIVVDAICPGYWTISNRSCGAESISPKSRDIGAQKILSGCNALLFGEGNFSRGAFILSHTPSFKQFSEIAASIETPSHRWSTTKSEIYCGRLVVSGELGWYTLPLLRQEFDTNSAYPRRNRALPKAVDFAHSKYGRVTDCAAPNSIIALSLRNDIKPPK